MTYTGDIAPVPLGTRGLAGNINQAQLDAGDLTIANNLTFQDGTLRKEGGTDAYNDTAISGTPSILGGHDWHPSSGTQRMIVLTDDGDLLKDGGSGDFATTLDSGLTTTDVIPQFIEGGKEAAANDRKLFCFTGKNAVQVLAADGATTADLATPPSDWSGTNQPSFGLVHEDRMWGGGNLNDPHRLYYSTTSDHEDFTGGNAGQLAIFPGEGEKLVAALSFRGFIICFKYPNGIYAVDTTSATIANWKVKRLTNKLGTLNALTALIAANDIIFLDVSGNPHILSATDEFGDVNNSAIGQAQYIDSYLRTHVNISRLTLTQGIYYEVAKEIHFAMPGSGSSNNNRRLVVDLNLPSAVRFRFSDRDIAISMWLRRGSDNTQRPVYGDNAGQVFLMDQDSRTNDGTGYSGEFQTAYTDLSYVDPSLATKRKLGEFVEIVAEPKGNWNLTMSILYDGETTETVQFNLGTTGAALGSFVLGTDKLAEERVINRKARITGSGRRVAFNGKNSGDGEDFSIAALYYHYRVGDERLA